MERWGDYTAIQRRYNDSLARCWLVGSYPNGFNTNHFGVTGGHNSFIAELGDSLPPLSSQDPYASVQGSLFPQPAHVQDQIRLLLNQRFSGVLQIVNVNGQILHREQANGRAFDLPSTFPSSGMYFVNLISQSGAYETFKILVLP
jgi:hypothetical protein